MTYRLLHTADWQIGRAFGGFPEDKRAVLREARLGAIDRLAAAAETGGAGTVVVAGDVFDSETAPDALLARVLARLAQHGGLAWHLLPGNHDPARPGGVWTRVLSRGLPRNVQVHIAPGSVALAGGGVLLPAPLTSRASSRDPTAWMDEASSAPGLLRIGLAHGSIQGFGSEGEAAQRIAADRARLARLDYLALGDWHGLRRVSDRTWYSGTPEPDRFPDNEPGHALLVSFEAPGATPRVEPVATAQFRWQRRQITVRDGDSLRELLAEIEGARGGASRWLIELTLAGRVAAETRGQVLAALERIEAAVFHLETRLEGLAWSTGDGARERLPEGPIRSSAERLEALAAAEGSGHSRTARHALHHLHRLLSGLGQGGGA